MISLIMRIMYSKYCCVVFSNIVGVFPDWALKKWVLFVEFSIQVGSEITENNGKMAYTSCIVASYSSRGGIKEVHLFVFFFAVSMIVFGLEV